MATVILSVMAKEELAWWIKNLELSSGWVIIPPLSQILMQADASKKGGVSMDKNWGPVIKEGTGVSYKSSTTFSNKICTSNFQQNDEF